MGAVEEGISYSSPVYSASKTMLNLFTRQLAHVLPKKGIIINAVCPGWVRTRMGGEGASRSVEKGAETVVWLATEATAEWNGKFFRDKKEIPW
jgi:NAD(P)-dependent dehydrogenase (short-subunit alcohol dehydrogenase family)